ncbi:hypothetical protein CERSUDRAFT_127595 [Gelatoporia subvermispora B]|uniref:Uncharacterized protein n=1 Tax=Ceriporiopsis subvermispora (strain B) TaxID=914234 RepID=M2QYY3_CERS8|nr:hypothetical protein CERSUDRAFT_127595 [Gelatoporia subvermispora B]
MLMASTTTSVGSAVRRTVARAAVKRTIHRNLSVLPASVSVTTSIRPSYLAQSHLDRRWSSTATAQTHSAQLEHDEYEAEETGESEIPEEEHEGGDGAQQQRAEPYLTWHRSSGKKFNIRWRTKVIKHPGRKILMSRTDFVKLADEFIKLIDDAGVTTPCEENAPKLLDLINQRPEDDYLRVLAKYRSVQFMADYLAKIGQPRYALHAMCVACFGSALEQAWWWSRIAALFGERKLWEWMPMVLELQYKLDGKTTSFELNRLLESDIQRGIYPQRPEIIQLYKALGVGPGAQTRSLISKSTYLAEQDPEAPTSPPDGGVRRLLELVIPKPGTKEAEEKAKHTPVPPELVEEPGQTVAPYITFGEVIPDPPNPPRKDDAPLLIQTLHKHPEGRKLLKIFFTPKRAVRMAGRLIRAGMPLHGIHVINISWRLKPDPDRETFDRAARVLVEARLWEWVPVILNLELDATGGKSTVESMNRLLSAWYNLGIRKEREEIVEMYRKAGLEPRKSTETLIQKLEGLPPSKLTSETLIADTDTGVAPALSEEISQPLKEESQPTTSTASQ